jgi:uncharacterized protein
MGKVVFWLVVVFLALLVLRLAGATAAKRRRPRAGAERQPAPPAETMVRCRNCGVYLPREDAVADQEGFVCGDPACARRR